MFAGQLIQSAYQASVTRVVRRLTQDAHLENIQRRHVGRTPYFRPVVLHLGLDFVDRQTAFTRDISSTGVGLLHCTHIEPQEVILSTQLESDELFQLVVDVSWCMPCGEGWYISGGAFQRLANRRLA